MVRIVFAVALSLTLFGWVEPSQSEDLNVFTSNVDEPKPKEMLARYLNRLTSEAFARRKARYEGVKSPEEIAAYQAELRTFFLNQIGGLPQQTPLNAKIVGKLAGEKHRVEKIIFESQPHHFVTGLLYLPLTEAPYPGVIVPCGHSANGKAASAYQRVCILLARNGIAAFCYDPIGQGERYQLLNANGKPQVKSTTEHTLVGVGSILVGRNTATYRIWDGMRALDYLESRQDIDKNRLGCTGNSGGGTLTEYLMALDPRIKCAVPSCCITSFERKIATIGPGDAEQNIFGQIGFGMDHAEYILMRAPRPTLLATATHDFVDIEGAWDIFREAKRFYTRMGFAERIDLLEVDGKHGYSQLKREAAVRWLRRWFLDQHDPITEPEFDVYSAKEVQCHPNGQVQTENGAVSVMDLNLAFADNSAKHRQKLWQPANRETAMETVRKLTGIRKLQELPETKTKKLGQVTRTGYTIEKWTLTPEADITLPALLFKPEKPTGSRILYLHDEGKATDATIGGPIEKLVNSGAIVLAIDVRGAGEIGSSSSGLWGGNWDDIFVTYLLGKTMLGMRAEDILVSARFLSAWESSEKTQPVELIAIGHLGPPALHAVALHGVKEEKRLFKTLTLRDSLNSWYPALKDAALRGQLVNAVHAALQTYDLKDLIESLPEGSVILEQSESSP